MPGLVMFGRRWGFGSDDLVVTTIVVALLHAVWYATLRHVTFQRYLLKASFRHAVQSRTWLQTCVDL